jgi:hypothetical protein
MVSQPPHLLSFFFFYYTKFYENITIKKYEGRTGSVSGAAFGKGA